MANTPLEFPREIDLSQFISHHAHDLRAPFNHIMGFSKIMLREMDGPLTDAQKTDLTTVYNSGIYAFTLMSSLVDVARLLTGEKTITPGYVDTAKLIEQSITQWQKYHPDQNVQFERLLLTASATFPADEILFRQAISGLIVCAVECVQKPAKVTVVVDDEPGLLVFTIHSEGDPSPSPSRLDLELNGYIAQSIISLHGGQFRQQEISSYGAVIQFTLPAA